MPFRASYTCSSRASSGVLVIGTTSTGYGSSSTIGTVMPYPALGIVPGMPCTCIHRKEVGREKREKNISDDDEERWLGCKLW